MGEKDTLGAKDEKGKKTGEKTTKPSCAKTKMKHAALRLLADYFVEDDSLILLVEDCGFAAIDPIKQHYPRRVINCGIREQAIISAAAGMAKAGLSPIVYGIAIFLILRAAEQIYQDIILPQRCVKLIGVGAGDTFKHLGSSHHCRDIDIRVADALGLPWFWPITKTTLPETIGSFVAEKQPCYLRLC